MTETGNVRLPALLRAMRPHQWTKNLFVFAPLLFERHFERSGRNLRVVAAFGIFCCLASGVYLLNDVVDREADRLHPQKRARPVAAGEISAAVAGVLAAVLLLGGLAWAHLGLESWPFTMVCAAYVAVQAAYSLGLKRAAIVDVLCVSSGFVFRLLAGAAAAWVHPSPWILLCTIFVSLFLALCKRRHEVVSLGSEAAAHRTILAEYPPALLDQLIGVAASATLVTYALWTVDGRTTRMHHLAWRGDADVPVLAATIPFVIFGVFRYLFLVYSRDQGGSPTTTLLRDVPSVVNGVLYLAATLAIFRLFGA